MYLVPSIPTILIQDFCAWYLERVLPYATPYVLATPDHTSSPSEEPPPDKQQYKQPQPRQRSILLQQQLPINPHRRLSILPTILLQPTTHIAHPLQTIPSIQQILNILRHHLRDIPQLIIQLIQILRRAAITIRSLRLLNKRIKLHKRIRSQYRRHDLLGGIRVCEFRADVREVGEGQFPGVGFLADADVDDVVGDEVVDRVRAAFDGGLRFRVVS
jgi:hypothetical protein